MITRNSVPLGTEYTNTILRLMNTISYAVPNGTVTDFYECRVSTGIMSLRDRKAYWEMDKSDDHS